MATDGSDGQTRRRPGCQGSQGRVGQDNNRWVLWQDNQRSQPVDTIQFRATAITGVHSSGSEESKTLGLDEKVARLDGDRSIPLTALSEISISDMAKRRHGRGAGAGLGLGALSGAAIGALVGAAVWEECTCEGWECFGCIGTQESRGAAAGVGALIGGVLDGVTGLVVGGLTGTRVNTIYRFRPNTPQQMSVVIGVGPTAPAHASIE